MRILLAGGGTAGHTSPLLATADALRRLDPDAEITCLGTPRGLENKVVPAAGYRWWHWGPVASFWTAYVLTRPLGASVADWTGKPTSVGGLGIGDGLMSLVFAVAIVAMVALLARRGTSSPAPGAQPGLAGMMADRRPRR